MFEFEVVYSIPKFTAALFLIAAILTTVLSSVYICNRLESRAALYRILCVQLVVLIIQLGQFLSTVSPPEEYPFFIGMECVGVCLLGQSILHTTGIFPRRHGNYKRVAVLISIVSLAGIALVITNGRHSLFYTVEGLYNTRFNTAFHVFTLYSLLCLILAGRKYLSVESTKNNKHKKLQRVLIMAGIMFITAAAVLDSINLFNTYFLIMPSCIMIAQLAFLAAYIVDADDLKVFASRSNLLDVIDEAVIIAGLNGKILYHNDSRLTDTFDTGKHGNVDEVFKALQNVSKVDVGMNSIMDNIKGKSCGEVTGEVELGIPENTFVRLTLNPLKGASGHRIGSLLTLRDVSEYSNIIREMDINNRRLVENNRKLEQYARVRHRLASGNERQKIINSINRTIGCSLREITSILKRVENNDEGHVDAKAKIMEAAELSRRTIEKVRESVSGYASSPDSRKEHK